MSFKALNLHPTIEETLSAMGYQDPTPVQQQAIPEILKGHDIMACAQTGTGKTAAFLLPVIHKIISGEKTSGVNTLIIVPTRELAIQIDQMLEGFSYFTSISSLAMYGGTDSQSFSQQKKALQNGVEIVVATPGKLISHLNLSYAKLDQLEHLILDEADKMLDMGFYEDIMRIVNQLPKNRQNLLFSATMPPKIRKLAKELLKDPVEINIALSKAPKNVLQGAFVVPSAQKNTLVKHILKKYENLKRSVVFCNTKREVDSLYTALKDFKVAKIHADLTQSDREQTLIDFKNDKYKTIIATSILSRGIDIDDIQLVINYNVPDEAEDYVHRIGRTARANRKGIALTLIDRKEEYKFKKIEELTRDKVVRYKSPV